MLITSLKNKEALATLLGDKKVFVINCYGCREVSFPEAEANEYQEELKAAGAINPPMIIAAVVIAVALIVASFIVSKILFGGGLSGGSDANEICDKVSASLSSAKETIGYNVADSKLCIANTDSYIVYFQTDDYKLYSLEGKYRNAGGTYADKLKEAMAASLPVVCIDDESF